MYSVQHSYPCFVPDSEIFQWSDILIQYTNFEIIFNFVSVISKVSTNGILTLDIMVVPSLLPFVTC
jgi:hypothetical protein